jgi:hypothetical protein
LWISYAIMNFQRKYFLNSCGRVCVELQPFLPFGRKFCRVHAERDV